jgi:hypothetical protein
VDAQTGEFNKVGETRAWNLQQGAMIYWNPLDPENEIIFNDRHQSDPGKIISVILNVKTGRRREMPLAIAAVSHNGRSALSLDYGRLHRLRPVVGYVGAKDPNPDSPHPKNDGIFSMDLATGEHKLIVSYERIYQWLVKDHPILKKRHLFFNHIVFNKDDTRFFFLARIWKDDQSRQLESAMFTAKVDGSDLREVVPFGKSISHFEWRNSKEIIATFLLDDLNERQHVLFTDGLRDYQVIGEGFLKGDGHCSLAPDGEWMVTDRNDSSTQSKLLMIYHLGMKKGLLLGAFPMQEFFSGDLRCDLHPRWNRTGDEICFDALDTRDWTRQLHIAYLKFKGTEERSGENRR